MKIVACIKNSLDVSEIKVDKFYLFVGKIQMSNMC